MRKKISYKVVVYVLIVVLFFWFIYLSSDYYKSKNSVVGKMVSNFEEVPVPNVSDHYKWKNKSEYTFVNYFSLDCPYCLKVSEMEDENRVKYENSFNLIYRHSPLTDIQPLSAEKAVIAECVFVQSGNDTFFKYVSYVFSHYEHSKNYNTWAKIVAEKFVGDSEKLHECINSESMKAFITKKRTENLSYKINGTPTIAVFKGENLILRIDRSGESQIQRVMDSLIELNKMNHAN